MNSKLKLKRITPEEVAEVTGGELVTYGEYPREVTSVADSSADVTCGSLFIAFKGERADGAEYLEDAMSKGAVAALTERIPDGFNADGKPFSAIVVESTVAALGKLAAWYRGYSEARFIAVTGSVGKTSTKEMIATVTSVRFRTHKTEGNRNNEIGLPLSMFGLSPDDKVAVMEMGMSAFGEISYLTNIVKPDIALITNIGTSHIANLGSRENICKAKLEIIEGLGEDGVLFINGDEPLLTERAGELPVRVKQANLHSKTGEFRAMNVRTDADGSKFDLIYDGKVVTNTEVPIAGIHNVYNALMAYAVGAELGMSDDEIRRGIKSFKGANRRQNVYELGGLTVIDDCYNASPESMRAAIDVLISLAAKKKKKPCALLGDMLELGDYSRLMHDKIGQYAANSGVEKLFCYGALSSVIAESAVKNGIRIDRVAVCPDAGDPARMAGIIKSSLEGDEILLVKASNGIHAERVIGELKALLSPADNGKKE